jgi:hypothetical protein
MLTAFDVRWPTPTVKAVPLWMRAPPVRGKRLNVEKMKLEPSGKLRLRDRSRRCSRESSSGTSFFGATDD